MVIIKSHSVFLFIIVDNDTSAKLIHALRLNAESETPSPKLKRSLSPQFI